MSKYYKESGKVPALSFVYFLLACITLIPILAAIYSYCIRFIPFPYINFFIAIGFGFGVGLVVSFLALKLGKVRNSKMAGIFGLLGGLAALYIHWGIWLSLVVGGDGNVFGQALNFLSAPGPMFQFIGEIKEIGVWGLGDSAVNGTPLMIIWIIEALMIVIIPLMISSGSTGDPFCEVNNKWFTSKTLDGFNYIDNGSAVVTALEGGDDEALANLSRAEDVGTQNHSKFTLYANETNENYLTIENKVAKVDDKGEVKFELQPVVKNISISEALSKRIEGFFA